MNKNISKIYIAADHRGVGVKLYLIEMLAAIGYNLVNLGTDDLNTPVDFPDVAKTLADAMAGDEKSRGILICGTGAGMQIAANRYRHIRASRCERPDQARDDRFHDDINVLALAADDIDIEVSFLVARAFLESPFDNSERRVRRLKKIS
ncbi:MAG: RpiB/LacA/LacB family sugar-phosphate isomerase [Proteobacteria bacterium]|uniref:RpiB/LacA/LacB family sugar-phosphate isomerase n=1 Tax=Candidatus Enterousia excrementavium TaxID=2840789 RepID=A0A940DDQ5_9PROT|nr:RpiB/LacA/LacB family sugar-phosphate isomerase [Candidatus Enterousia excrementavium]